MMSQYEITNGQYCDFLNSAYPAQIKEVGGVIYAVSDTGNNYPYFDTRNDSRYVLSQVAFSGCAFSVRSKGGRSMVNDPVVEVGWYGAKAFCDYYDYRLPTEAEWEYAARGGLSGRRFPWGDTINHSYANYMANGSLDSYDTSSYTINTFHPTWNDGIDPYTSPVGSFSANGYGLYDMTGNVWELCSDWIGKYPSSPQVNPTGPATGYYRVLRGGSYYYNAVHCRVALRVALFLSAINSNIGFRVCMD